MDDKLFKELEQSLREMVDHSAGKKMELRTTKFTKFNRVFKKADVTKIRKRMNVSQGVFATILNVSTKTVQSWEQGTGTPSGPSAKLLDIADHNPAALIAK